MTAKERAVSILERSGLSSEEIKYYREKWARFLSRKIALKKRK